MGRGVEECHGGACDELRGGTVDGVTCEGVHVGGDEDGDGAGEALWNDAGAERESNGKRGTAGEHLACKVLV